MAISKIDTVDRPDSVALMDAIENCIYEIASEKMTAFEVLGVLDLVSKEFYKEHFIREGV